MSVYFILCDSVPEPLVKIGKAGNVKSRLSQIATSTPFEIKLIAEFSYLDEADLHKKFAHLRVKNEWFRFTDEISSFISVMNGAVDFIKVGTKEIKRTGEWKRLVRLEPRLMQLEKDIISEQVIRGKDKNYCATRRWFNEYNNRLDQLVGWFAKNSQIQTSKDYDVALEHLFDNLMPNCRHKGIFC